MKFIYCPLCGIKLEEKYSWDEGGVPYCPNDDKMFFDTPKPCIVVAVIKGDEVLLLKQSYIYTDCKVLLSGYVGNNETVEDTVYREVLEESGIKVDNIEYLGSDFVKDKEIVMLTYMAKYKEGKLKKSDEVEGIEWSKLDSAISQMTKDNIGKRVIKKVIDKMNI
ncbi:MAG: NAD(+) diphosphatase [Clostridium sp.]